MTQTTNKPEVMEFLICEDGTLQAADFEQRTFEDALAPTLKGDWRASPQVLADAIADSPDILTVVISLKDAWNDLFWQFREDVEARIEARTKELESAGTENKDDEILKSLYEELSAADEEIWSTEEKTPAQWIASIDKDRWETEYVDTLESFFSAEIDDSWSLFNPAFDTPEGRAVHELRQLSVDALEALGVEFYEAEDASMPLKALTNIGTRAANAAAKKMSLPLHFRSAK